MLELVLQVAGAREHGLEMGVVRLHAGQFLMKRVELRPQVEQRTVRLHGAIEHGAVVTLGGLLRQVAHARAARAHAHAGLRRDLAEDEADERGLARAVRPHECAAVARADDPVHLVEEDALADAVADALELDHARSPWAVVTPCRNASGGVDGPREAPG